MANGIIRTATFIIISTPTTVLQRKVDYMMLKIMSWQKGFVYIFLLIDDKIAIFICNI